MDLELAAALRLSLVEMQTQESKEKQQDHEIMAQLQEWDAEIQRLKGWSDVFYKSLGTEPSEAEVKRLYSIFEQLARIGATFGALIQYISTVLCGFYHDS
jgi:ribonuclease D